MAIFLNGSCEHNLSINKLVSLNRLTIKPTHFKTCDWTSQTSYWQSHYNILFYFILCLCVDLNILWTFVPAYQPGDKEMKTYNIIAIESAMLCHMIVIFARLSRLNLHGILLNIYVNIYKYRHLYYFILMNEISIYCIILQLLRKHTCSGSFICISLIKWEKNETKGFSYNVVFRVDIDKYNVVI